MGKSKNRIRVEALARETNFRVEALAREMRLRDQKQALANRHQREIGDLRAQLSDKAISKAETALWERMDAGNHKYAQMKEQAERFATHDGLTAAVAKIEALIISSNSTHKADIAKVTVRVDWLTRIILMASGGFIVIVFLIKLYF